MKKDSWPVTAEHGPRPAGKPDECFYCGVKVGDEHAAGCVMRERTVVCRVSIDYVRTVPEDWDRTDIEFHMNESSSCANNLVNEITSLLGRKDVAGECMCGLVRGQYLREAIACDEKRNHVHSDSPGAESLDNALLRDYVASTARSALRMSRDLVIPEYASFRLVYVSPGRARIVGHFNFSSAERPLGVLVAITDGYVQEVGG